MATLFADANLRRGLVEELERRHHAVLAPGLGTNPLDGLSDADVLALAHAQGAAVVTCDRRDFVRLHEVVGHAHSGIIVCKQCADDRELARLIDDAVRRAGDLTGQLIRVRRPH